MCRSFAAPRVAARALAPLLLAAALLLAGCGGNQAATAPPVAGSPPSNGHASPDGTDARYVRRVAPFPVEEPGGNAAGRGARGSDTLAHPFLGGLNIPRPQIVDVDGDGMQDLFLQEENGRLIFFENVAEAGTPAKLVWRSSHYRGLDVGEWYRFVDLDGDGLLDLLAEQPYSYLRYYRNVGRAGAPQFERLKDTLRTVGGEPLFSDRQNIPNVADPDCDGRADLFVGRLDGTITRYEAVGPPEEGEAPRFRQVTSRFADIEIVGGTQPGQSPPRPGQQRSPLGGTGSSMHGANTMAFADVDGDGDGDGDLLWGDYFEKGLLLLENRGTCASLDFSNDPVPFPPGNPLESSGYNAPTTGDLTGNGLTDLLAGVIGGAYNPQRTTAANLYFYAQTADGQYEKRTERFLAMIDVGEESAPALGDLDGDGDLDLLVGNKQSTGRGGGNAPLLRYENVGTPGAPHLRLADTLALAPDAYNRTPALADLDGDGDLDLVVGTWREGLRLHKNTGTPEAAQFAEEGTALLDLERGSRIVPAFGDLDGDGDLDLVIGEADGSLSAFRNEAPPQAARFVRAPALLPDARADRRSAPALRDLDGDGDLDLLVGTEAGGWVFFRNEGTPQAPRFVRAGNAPFALHAPGLAVPAFGDLDGDGGSDLFVGAGRGGLFFFEDR